MGGEEPGKQFCLMLRLVTSDMSTDKKQNIPCPQKSTLVGELTKLWQP